MDWDDFERRAAEAKPDQPLKPKRCWVGVLRHDHDPQQLFTELDFIWMLGHGKITLEKIHATYKEREGVANFSLMSRPGVLDEKTLLKDIIGQGSEFIVFRAIQQGASPPVEAVTTSTSLGTPRSVSKLTGTSPSPATFIARNKEEPQQVAQFCASSPNTDRTREPPTGPHAYDVDQPLLPEVNVLENSSDASPHPGPSSLIQPTSSQIAPHSAATVNIKPEFSPATFHLPPNYPHAAGHAGIGPAFAPDRSALQGNNIDAPSHPQNPVFGRPPGPDLYHPWSWATAVGNNQHTPRENIDYGPSTNLSGGAPRDEAHGSSRFSASFIGEPPISWNANANALSDVNERVPPSPPVFLNEVEQEPSQPFDAGNFFAPEQDVQPKHKPTDEFIRDTMRQDDPELLEAGVRRAINVLEDFKHSFSAHAISNSEAKAWYESIDKLIPQAKRKRTVVGVVGNTGAGKSSVINALLDEERLVPTNCMRACTAVVTEMSWNDSADPFSKYRAEIEFISREDWEREVAMLMKEFLTETGTLQREASDQNTDAGIAWAKFHAVHPRIAKDELSDCTVARLMSDRGLNLLGTTKEINSSSPQRFYQELQKYVDSKEKVTKKEKKDRPKPAFEMEYWPLIKVVKIYTKAPALSTGAVIVDLPGVHDSNAARAAVAQGYIKQCTGLWIVAPITRAVDDKAAKTLLGDSFKTQLKYDGGFSNVTFICSKTDDISITEAIDTLQLEDDVETLYAEQTELEQHIQQTREKMEDLKESQRVFQLVAREAADDIELWEELQDRHDNGKAVYAPAPRKSKRKKSDDAKRARKKRQADAEDSDADFVVVDDEMTETEDEDSDDDEVQTPKEQLTEQDIKNKLKELRETKTNARREGLQMKPLIEELRPHIREAQKKINSIKAEVSKICISGRNEYSREAIQNDFAAGIKEIDQENAAEEDEDNFDPDEDQRDYDEVARSLPVFCVSSRAYQKMCGRLQKDDEVPGFNTLEETQIPQLQRHCTKLTEAGRVQTCRNFLSSVCQLLTTFTLWASNDGTGINLTDEDKQKQVRYIDGRLKELEEGLEACVKACINVMKREMNDQIFDKYPDLIREAIEAAPQTAESWGAHRSEGGLAWSTYKATVRRNGKYESKAAGHRDFNLQLIDPIVRKLATGWERAFQNRLPKAFTSYVADSGKVLRKFHEAVEQRARQNGVGLASLSALKTQIVNYEALFGELNQLLIASMTEQQRQANRDFSPTIAGIMQHVYDICVYESGPGSFKRMKDAMVGYVDQHRHNMFNHATMTVKHHLDMMCRSLQELMETRSDEIYIRMKADYMRVLGGVEVRQGAVMSREERHMRSEIMEKLRAVDSHFESISKGEITPSDEGTAARRESPTTDGGESIAFESAPELVHQDTAPRDGDSAMQESIMRDQDDSSIVDTSPTTYKRSKLPTPFSNEGSDAEL